MSKGVKFTLWKRILLRQIYPSVIYESDIESSLVIIHLLADLSYL